MPTISVPRDELFKIIGKTYTDAEFDELCFEFGIELDEVTTESKLEQKFKGHGESSSTKEAPSAEKDGNAEVVYRVEIPANRYDLLCLEGLSRALKVFIGNGKLCQYKLVEPKQGAVQQIIVSPETAQVRPFVVGAILRNVSFDAKNYQRFIDLQDKLHQNICRRRTLVAIGTHDLDTIQGPFYYKAQKPEDIKFKPLNQTKDFTAPELMAFYEVDSHLRAYLPIIRNEPRYPVIYDSKNTVLSLPPIINGDHSKITLATKNVFIECTATDRTKALVVLDIMTTMFSQYCAEQFTIEPVDVIYPDNRRERTPSLSYRSESVAVDYILKRVGINQTAQELATLLTRMSLSAEASADGKSITVQVPPTRADVIHACDIMEDVAIAYGYNNLNWTIPNTNTVGAQLPINKLSDLLRLELAMAGCTEVLTLSLCSKDENFTYLKKADDGSAVVLANPQSVEFQVARTSLLPGLLKTLSCNYGVVSLPVKVFEISDVVLKDSTKDTGARNERRLGAVFSDTSSRFEVIHGLLDRVMTVLETRFSMQPSDKGYYLKKSEDPMYFGGQAADIFVNGKKLGSMGVLHPQVLSSFGLANPVSALEINIEPFL